VTFDRETLGFYDASAAFYLGHRPDEVTAELEGFLDRLAPGARILELGCGGGRDARHMIARGFDVDATDGSAAMAAQAQAWIERPVRVMRFDELAADQAYDAVIAAAALLHVSRAELPAILTRIWRALRPGGWHWASFKTGGPAGRDEHGRYYNYLARADAEACYRGAGQWASITYAEGPGTAYFSAPADWLTVSAQKAAAPDAD
jgi:SAM-dependent methyltransferase